MNSLFIGMFVSLAVATVGAPFVFKMLVAMKSRQNVSAHLAEHAHKQGTPTMGGLIILLGLVAGMISVWQPGFVAPTVLLVGFGLVGFLDDYLMPKWKPGSRGLSWLPKLGLEVGASVVAALTMGWSEPWAIGLFVFMILFLSNAYNFSDGLDTLSGGLGLILALGFLAQKVHSTLFPQGFPQAAEVEKVMRMFVVPSGNEMLVMGALAMGFVPFLVLNAAPAKVFMGDVGALPIGALFGWVACKFLVTGTDQQALQFQWVMVLPLLVMLLVMFVEIVPVPLQIASVKLRKKRLFNFKTPVHHALQDKGWPETRIAMLFHMVQLGLVFIAFGMMVMGGA